MDFGITIEPHTDAARMIRAKKPVTREVFDALLPELRARAFTVTQLDNLRVQARIRDRISDVVEGELWDKAKNDIISDLEPILGDMGAKRRAELLLRTHAFQAYQASTWRTSQADEDTTHLQYLSTEDEVVRDSHAALNGVILPKDDPFWDKHYPPWEWNCRCNVRPMNSDMVNEAREDDERRNPENKLVVEGPALKQLRNGTLFRDGQKYDVTPPSETDEPHPYQWHPDHFGIPLDQLERDTEPELWTQFVQVAKATKVGRTTLYQWLKASPV
jgi:SPP1 gp7 family putative phage head morphogenesis protein